MDGGPAGCGNQQIAGVLRSLFGKRDTAVKHSPVDLFDYTFPQYFTTLNIMYKLFISMLCAVLLTSGCNWIRPVQEEKSCPEIEPVVCPAPEKVIVEKIVTKEVPAPLPPLAMTAGKMHFPIVGAVEWATVNPPGLKYEARLDTGAKTTSIHAQDIRLLEKDGKRYVRFKLIDPSSGESFELERKLQRTVLIKQSDDVPSERRYVVKLWLTLGKAKELIEVNLTDRSDYDYPLLIGRNFLTDTAIVDVSRHHTVAK